jgi:hypothetical protein
LKKIVGIAALVFLGSMSSSNAQVPGGSYQASCGNIRFDGEQLSAVCVDARGRRVPTSLDVRGCAGGIANNNGQLVCNVGGPPGYGGGRYHDDEAFDRPRRGRYREDEAFDWPRRGPPPRDFGGGLPGGSWRASCTNAEMRGPILNAMCLTARGDYRPASADVRQCPSFSNRNGSLVCGG